ncbi:amidase [Leucobacter sp. USHLN154]|uniref:amidase n=1 Tax=Leucobacter sp. USHLN154 TaxID=3081269 RepID=UPI00301B6C66
MFITRATIQPSADGPLSGWPIAVKDNIDVAGLPTTGGTKYLTSNMKNEDAPVVSEIRRAGGTIVGKTNLHELGHGISGINPTFGTTRHPFDPALTVGGSSGGSALAVLFGAARIALGTDTGGSVRIPASYCGLLGYRPTAGRYSTAGVLGISTTRDAVGLISRSVSDIRLMDSVLAKNAAPAAVRVGPVGVLEETLQALDDVSRSHFIGALNQAAGRGIEISSISRSRHLDRCFELGLIVLAAETKQSISMYLETNFALRSWRELVEASETPDTRKILEKARDTPVNFAEYNSAKRELRRLNEDFAASMAKSGIRTLAYPTVTSDPPVAQATPDIANTEQQLKTIVMNSTPATLYGNPAISIPIGKHSQCGIPLGLTLEQISGDDFDLFEIAEQFTVVTREPPGSPRSDGREQLQ